MSIHPTGQDKCYFHGGDRCALVAGDYLKGALRLRSWQPSMGVMLALAKPVFARTSAYVSSCRKGVLNPGTGLLVL
jgi:hypothetical protein